TNHQICGIVETKKGVLKMKNILLLPVFLLFMAGHALPYQIDETWQDISYGIDETDMRTAVFSPENPDTIYAGSSKSIFKSADAGKTWQKLYLVRGTLTAVNAIAVDPKNPDIVYAGTQNGLLLTSDGGKNWNRLFEGLGGPEKDVKHLLVSSDGKIFLATAKGIFISADAGKTWRKPASEISDHIVNFLACETEDCKIMYAASNLGVFKSDDSGASWKCIFNALAQTFESETPEDTNDTEDIEAPTYSNKTPNCLAIDRLDNNKLYFGTDTGVFVFSDGKQDGGIEKLTASGLLNPKITSLISTKEGILYAATKNGVFKITAPFERWEEVYNGLASKDIRYLVYDKTDDMILAATAKGIYRISLKAAAAAVPANETEMNRLLANFKCEPTIREIQQAAIKYAEVNKEKIDGWRKAAQAKAILPSLNVGIDKYWTDYYHWDAGPNPDVLQKGKAPTDWSVSVSWDLGELIWNNDQTSIDVRSRLMVQLRDDILDEVTRLYFERRKVQIELLTSPPKGLNEKLTKELRLQELTASIDALTGGWLSKKIGQTKDT
ncbi:MAG: YCF48-related protein, partial [Candidatus Omnitrophica bacterium]|nr:YCF48-related protein [Candidatus Omnitrophota bacterium]